MNELTSNALFAVKPPNTPPVQRMPAIMDFDFLPDMGRMNGEIVLNRKNALFAGRAENWACIASLIETCKLHGVDPQAYFTDVPAKLVNLWPASRLDELMPWAWAAEHSANRLAA